MFLLLVAPRWPRAGSLEAGVCIHLALGILVAVWPLGLFKLNKSGLLYLAAVLPTGISFSGNLFWKVPGRRGQVELMP